MSFTSAPRGLAAGFTIIELLVSMSIMLGLSTMIAFNQSHYTSGAELKNLANNLGLSLRQAQVYGIAVKEFSPGQVNSNNFSIGYGVNFNITGGGSNKEYLFFADRNLNSLYDGTWSCLIGGANECLDKTSLTSKSYISKLCSIDASGNEDCTPTRLDITFVRPAIESKIAVNGVPAPSSVKGVRVELSSSDGTKKNSVVVYVTGQISVR